MNRYGLRKYTKPKTPDIKNTIPVTFHNSYPIKYEYNLKVEKNLEL